MAPRSITEFVEAPVLVFCAVGSTVLGITHIGPAGMAFAHRELT